jgi:hypothetical protein
MLSVFYVFINNLYNVTIYTHLLLFLTDIRHLILSFPLNIALLLQSTIERTQG